MSAEPASFSKHRRTLIPELNYVSYDGDALQKIFLTPVTSVVNHGASCKLSQSDLWRLKHAQATETGWAKFSPYWEIELQRDNPSLLRALLKAFGFNFVLVLGVLSVNIASHFALPVLMPYLIQWVTHAQQLPMWWVLTYVFAIFGATCTGAIFNCHAQLILWRWGLNIRAAIATLIYRKSLHTVIGGIQSSGAVTNLLSTDAQIVLESLPSFMLGCMAPIQVAVTIGLLSRLIGWFCLLPLAIAVVSTPISIFFTSKIVSGRYKMQQKSDNRLKLIKELLNAVQIIKYYAWEHAFSQQINEIRHQQVHCLMHLLLMRLGLMSTMTNIPIFSIGFTLFFYGIRNTVSLESVFTSITYLNLLRTPFTYLPVFLALLAQYRTSLKRISVFVLRAENQYRLPDADPEEKGGMSIENGSFAWESELSIAECRYLAIEKRIARIKGLLRLTDMDADRVELDRALTYSEEELAFVSKYLHRLYIKSKTKSGFRQESVKLAAESTSGGESAEQMIEVDDDKYGQYSNHPIYQLDDTHNIEVFSEVDALLAEEAARFAPFRTPLENLTNVNLRIEKCSLTAVVGSVSSGKSSLAMAFLGEMTLTRGKCFVSSKVTLAAQVPWIFGGTIRDNICFGKPYDPDWYAEVIQACALTRDLNIFVGGDMTEIAERGSNLSGGQRQRISVARAMYSKSPIVILDDPFSAVDPHVAEHMYQHVAIGMKHSGRSVLLITNQIHLLSSGCDRIAVMKKGQIVEQGTYQALQDTHKGIFARILAKSQTTAAATTPLLSQRISPIVTKGTTEPFPPPSQVTWKIATHGATQIEAGRNTPKPGSAIAASSDDESPKSNTSSPALQTTAENDEQNYAVGKLIKSEMLGQGNIGFSTYWNYIRSGSVLLMMIALLMMLLRSAVRIFGGIWLSWWSEPVKRYSFTPTQYLGGYISFILGEALFAFLGALALIFFAMRAAPRIHNRLMDSATHAPIVWFDATPIGRILTRFAKDIDTIDVLLPQATDQVLNNSFMLLGIVISIAVGTPFVLIIVVIGGIIFCVVTMHYRKTSIQVQRIEAVSRAPIFSHLAESLEGAVTIRSFGMVKSFEEASMRKIDASTRSFMGLRLCSTWFFLTQDLLGSSFVLLCLIALALVRVYLPKSVSVGYVIFAISNLGNISSIMLTLSNAIIDLENKMNSTERVLEFSHLPSEAPFHVEDPKPNDDWPSKGAIAIDNLNIEYKKDKPVLKKVTLEIEAGQRIGIVGRTGAGKSTLINALFRLIEFTSGTIHIDGVDISKIGLHDLRSRLSIIPQTPQLFMGTLRYNLDPFDEYTDEVIWEKLEMVNLKNDIKSMEGELLATVDEGGSNFSLGQRQLISMTRCLLRDARILLLDEATAALDLESDALIQRMLRQNFAGKTVITIAHRLETVMDNDKIIVLDAGEIVEMGKPSRLLRLKGVLSAMVESTGVESASNLRAIAFGKDTVLASLERKFTYIGINRQFTSPVKPRRPSTPIPVAPRRERGASRLLRHPSKEEIIASTSPYDSRLVQVRPAMRRTIASNTLAVDPTLLAIVEEMEVDDAAANRSDSMYSAYADSYAALQS